MDTLIRLMIVFYVASLYHGICGAITWVPIYSRWSVATPKEQRIVLSTLLYFNAVSTRHYDGSRRSSMRTKNLLLAGRFALVDDLVT
jgi:hypothetical protein